MRQLKAIICRLSLVTFSLFFVTPIQAATVTYFNRTAWNTAIGGAPSSLVDFNGFTVDRSLDTPLDVGPFSLQQIGGNYSVLDALPLSSATIDGTPQLNIYVDETISFDITFDSPIGGFGADFLYPGNTFPLLIDLKNGSGTTFETLSLGTGLDNTFFGFVVDPGLSIAKITFRNTVNDGFTVDNIGIRTAAVPEPSALLLLGSGMLGLVGYGRRRFKK